MLFQVLQSDQGFPRAETVRLVERLKAAKRPTIVVGHGARFHMTEITKLAETLGAAVLTTTDHLWASCLLHEAERAGLPLWPTHVATDTEVLLVDDDLLAA